MSRKLKLQMQMTIDGFVAGPKGEMDFMTWNWGDDIKKYVAELTTSIDAIILGRKLAEGLIPHWENVASDPKNPEVVTGKLFSDTPKIVFSKNSTTSNWSNTVLASDLVLEVNKLKIDEGKDIIAYGGAEFVSNLIKAGLIDEFHMFVNPVVIGQGMSIFHSIKHEQDLELIKSQTFECGINLLVYKLK